MNYRDKLKEELSILMHEIMKQNKEIFDNGSFDSLLVLCEQDIAILSCMSRMQNATAKELSRLLNEPKTTIVSAVARLEQRGYIVKVPNENDRRERFLCLTEKGLDANLEHEEYENLILDKLTDIWKEEDQAKLVDVLSRRESLWRH